MKIQMILKEFDQKFIFFRIENF